ncbi:MAG: NAD-glutamate dehydrogenase [Caulobacteraceae bacterium]
MSAFAETTAPPTIDHPSPEPLLGAFAAALGVEPGTLTAEQSGFVDRIAQDLLPAELTEVASRDLVYALAEFWRLAEGADADAPLIRIDSARAADGHPLGLDLLEIVQADRPFLVDSVMGQIVETGAAVRAMFHPIVERRDRRWSMIQIWLEPLGAERRAALTDRVAAALADVRAAVDDFGAMLALLGRCIQELAADYHGDADDLAESLDFLRWMDAGHFVFLGARAYEFPRTPEGGYVAEEPVYTPEGSLGVLRDQALRVLRRASEPAVLSEAARRGLEGAEGVIVAKSNLRSRVHRRAYMDYVGVRRYGPDGKACGEVRFVGLFTARAYTEPARSTPLLRRKLAKVMTAAGFGKGGHNGMRLDNILETYPRDELFQISVGDLLANALDTLHLFDRPRVKLFARADPFDRFASVLVYVPRERYDDRVRERAGQVLAQAYGGRISAYYPSYSDAPLARVHYIVGFTPGDHLHPDLTDLEARIARVARTWDDDLQAMLRAAELAGDGAASLAATWARAFPIGYRDRYGPEEALADVQAMETLARDGPREAIAVRAFRIEGESALRFRFKLYRRGESPASLARVLPILGGLGLGALMEEGFATTPQAKAGGHGPVWVHEFVLEDEHGEHLRFDAIKAPFEAAFTAIWNGLAESDGFNRLVLELALSWREAALVRALASFRQQSGLDPRQAAQEAALTGHAEVTRLILELFHVRLDPTRPGGEAARDAAAQAMQGAVEEALRGVASLDDDRVLRRMAALVAAITRTNFFQSGEDGQPKPYIAFKIASRELVDLPDPKPFREIFVAAPHVEGVHLRFGPVARGGLRWSDRRDDFRTEVLGLVKAQQVKNAVIVPVGSKGGFYPKQLPRGGDPEAIRAEALRAYTTFLQGLLDLTDNLAADGRVLHPPAMVIHDGDDPYLVVAADKGTATFSDIANGVAKDYDFWLDDAFASGGSAGYDHKAMGITARGAWKAVERHFREMGRDVARDPTTVIGIGDMSGDVFGNGMLLSKALKLRAAFDHRHIFLDPDPDPERAWAERRRLFDLPRSSWADYDASALSPAGAVFARSLKSIDLSEPVRALLDLKIVSLTPNELICAILKSRADLLYFGGIGTYVKAASETQLDVGDKTNDAIRINGRDLRCKVVSEGANLGLTQAGRIEFASAGGRIETDAIDNSAGVDTSDHEVNIKIATGMAERAGELTRPDRDRLLATMTDEVADHVLQHNYDQSLALSLMEADGARDLDAQAQFMSRLEAGGRLNRALEGLPGPPAIALRSTAGKGLTRPELAVLLAYGKIELFDEIIGSQAPDDPYFEETLEGYFPREMGRFAAEIRRHRLRREIIATVIGNEMVNLCGPTFPSRLRAAAGCDATGLVAAFEAARQVLRFADVWARVEKLDGRAPAAGQIALFRELALILRGQTFWLARRAARAPPNVQALVRAYRPAVDTLKRLAPGVLSSFEQKAAVRRAGGWIKAGAPKDIAHSVALMRPLTLAANLSDLAHAHGWPLAHGAFVYHRVGGTLGFDRLRAAAGEHAGADGYERLATRRLLEDMLDEQASLAGSVMAHGPRPEGEDPAGPAAAAVAAWSADRAESIRSAKRTMEEIERAPGGWTFAKLTLANGALRGLAGV